MIDTPPALAVGNVNWRNKMKRFFRTTASLLTATTMLLGGISLSTICNQQSKAVYDRDLDYDPDLQPNYHSIDNRKSLENEPHRLVWCMLYINRPISS